MALRAEQITVLGMKKEAAFAETPTASAQTIWPDIVQTIDGLFDDIDWKVVRARGGDREPYQLVEGKHVCEGTINGIVQTGRWIAQAFGVDAVTGVSPYTHTIDVKNGMPFPSWVMEMKYNDATPLKAYIKGMVADSITLTGAEEDLLKFSASVKAHSAIANAGADSVVTGLTTEPYQFHEATLTYFGSVLARATDFEFTMSQNGKMFWPYDDSANVKQFPKEYIPGAVSYDLKTTVVPEDASFFTTLKNAASNLACTINFTRGANDTLEIQATNCVVKSAPHPIPEEGEIRVPLEIVPRDVTVVIVNSTTGSYADAS